MNINPFFFIKISEFWKVVIVCGTSLGFPTNNMEDATFLRETALYHWNVLHRYENTRASKSFMQEMILTSKSERRKKNSLNTLFRPTTIGRQNDFQQCPVGKTCDSFAIWINLAIYHNWDLPNPPAGQRLVDLSCS